jgi:hypothetical protein
MKKEIYLLIFRSTMAIVLCFGTSSMLQAKKSGENSSEEKRERRGRKEPSAEIKAALRECAGGKKRDEMTEADREKARACMEAKGLPPPPGKGDGEGGRRRKFRDEDGEKQGRRGDRKKPRDDRPEAPPPENEGSGEE